MRFVLCSMLSLPKQQKQIVVAVHILVRMRLLPVMSQHAMGVLGLSPQGFRVEGLRTSLYFWV